MEQLLIQAVSNPLNTIGILLAFLGAMTVLAFFWGIIDFVLSRGNEEEEMEGRILVASSLYIAIFLFLVWEIIRWIAHVLHVI